MKYNLSEGNDFKQEDMISLDHIEFEVSGGTKDGFADAPVSVQVAFLTEQSRENTDALAKGMCASRIIKVSYDNELLGSFSTGPNIIWEAYPIFNDYPVVLLALYNLCARETLKKLLPLQKRQG